MAEKVVPDLSICKGTDMADNTSSIVSLRMDDNRESPQGQWVIIAAIATLVHLRKLGGYESQPRLFP